MMLSWFRSKTQSQKSSDKKEEDSPATAQEMSYPTNQEPTQQSSWFSRLKTGLKSTSSKIVGPLSSIFSSPSISQETYKLLKKSLIEADLGSQTVDEIMQIVEKEKDLASAQSQIKEKLLTKCQSNHLNLDNKYALMMVGVNGAGKTTTCAKIAHRYNMRSPLLIAADTYRAAATSQLQSWAQENNIAFFGDTNISCAGALTFAGLARAQEQDNNLTIIDTSGRLHTSKNLMQELAKVRSVILKKIEQSSLVTLLVLDASQGQNMLKQVEIFHQYTPLDGLILTKVDGTSKAGAIFNIMDKFKIPVYFVGCGEGLDDLQPFLAEQFIEALFQA